MKFTSEGVPIQWDGTDWLWYKRVMLNVFKEQELLEIVESKLKLNDCVTDEEKALFKKNGFKARRLIFTSLSPDLMHQVDEYESAPEIWMALKEIHESTSINSVKKFRHNELRSELQKCTATGEWQRQFSSG
ncbi:TPA: hypothetical protein N0F65_002504 [Lagenidium giganteum]|uniref:Uncharacterized protein n=1 Tax=Lagenidium giganteum TaxID=4803 RepID=A0AAV2YX36_9STRA|nr:TPA: hypothetical protein N0F65_002504 [Lagenidium giganteum]